MDDAETQKHLKLAGLEKTSSEEDIAALKGASDCVITVLSAVQLMLEEPQAMPPQNLKRKVETKLIELADIFDAGGYPARVEPVEVDGDCGDLADLSHGISQLWTDPVRRSQASRELQEGEGIGISSGPTHSPIRCTCNLPSRSRERLCCAT